MSLSSSLGRFLERDPIGYSEDGMNLYQAYRGNPITGLDPSGLKKLPGPYSPAGRMRKRLREAKKEHLAEVNRWSNEQKQRLGVALSGLCPAGNFTSINGCECTPEKCKAQAQELANAIVNAIAAHRRAHGDQPGGASGNISHNTCGDWAVFVQTAARSVNFAHLAAGDACFNIVNVTTRATWTTSPWFGVDRHEWVEIAIGNNPASTVVIDPWPTGGKGNLDDTSATTGWPMPPTRKPDLNFAAPPATQPAPPTTQPTTKP